MGEPGQRSHVIGTSLIIDKASKRPRWAQRLDWVFSALMWLVYLFLVRDALLDLIVLVKDTLEWVLAGDDAPYLAAISRFLRTLQDYAIVIVANGAALLIWAKYNQARFRKRDLRKPAELVSVEAMARLYGLPADDLDNWRQSRILIMRHDEHGQLLRVISVDPGVALSMKAEAATPSG